MPSQPQSFWSFSHELYKREGVADACLSLQDKYGLDVNLLLFCYWYGRDFGVLDTELLAKVLDFSTPWRSHVVQRLREARRWMKGKAEHDGQFQLLRERIKADELASEKYQQERIAMLALESSIDRDGPKGSAAAKNNIDLYLQSIELELDTALFKLLDVIAQAHKR